MISMDLWCTGTDVLYSRTYIFTEMCACKSHVAFSAFAIDNVTFGCDNDDIICMQKQ